MYQTLLNNLNVACLPLSKPGESTVMLEGMEGLGSMLGREGLVFGLFARTVSEKRRRFSRSQSYAKAI